MSEMLSSQEFDGQPDTNTRQEAPLSITDLNSMVTQLKRQDIEPNIRMQLAQSIAEIMYPGSNNESNSQITSDFAVYKFAEILTKDDPKDLRSLIAPIAWSTIGKKPACAPTEAGILLGLINQKTSEKYNQ